jgi:translation elongation factor EF-4
MDVFRQRLEDEHDANVIITAPTVPYKSKHALIAKYLGCPAQSISSHLQGQGGYN